MDTPSLLDTAIAEYHRRENVWVDRIAKEWTAERRGTLEARQMADLALWDAIIIFIEDPLARDLIPIQRCWESALALRDHVRAQTPWDAPAEAQHAYLAIRSLEQHLADAAAMARREADRVAQHKPERKAA